MGKHRWSGWPGAFCMYCYAEDFMEIAVGEGWYDVYDDSWDTEEHKKEAEILENNCPFVPEDVDPYSLSYPLEKEKNDGSETS